MLSARRQAGGRTGTGSLENDRSHRQRTTGGTAPLSVVIPSYNQVNHLPVCLSAFLAQVPQPSEIIIVDDASTDGSLDVARAFSEKFSLIKVIEHSANQGAPEALNTGLHAAAEEFVLFGAADDFPLPGLVGTGVDQLKQHPSAGLFTAEVALIDADSHVIGYRPAFLPTWSAKYLSPSKVSVLLENGDNFLSGSANIYRRKLLLEIGGFDTVLGSFCDGYASRLLALRHGFCFVPTPLAAWRIIPDSISHKTASQHGKNMETLSLALDKWIAEDMRGTTNGYAELFELRWRFSVLRHMLLNGPFEVDMIMDTIGGSSFDRRIVSLLCAMPFAKVTLLLGWFTIKKKPVSLWALLFSGIRRITLDVLRRPRIDKYVQEINGPTNW